MNFKSFRTEVDFEDLARATGDAEAYKLACKGGHGLEEYGCRNEDAQEGGPRIRWEGGECPVPPGAFVEATYRVVNPACTHNWYFSHKGAMCKKCRVKR